MEKLKNFTIKYYWLISIILIFSLALYLRTIPGYKMEYPHLQSEADCYLTYRLGLEIIDHGTLPKNDTYAAYGTYPTGFNRVEQDYGFNYYTFTTFYSILNPIFGVSFYWVGVWIPALLGALQVLLLYFVAREIFNDKRIAIMSSALLAVIPGVLYRSSAGWMDKEPMAGIFMLIGLLFLFRGLREKEIKTTLISKILGKLKLNNEANENKIIIIRMIIYGLLAGMSFYFMNGTWGGLRFILAVIGAFLAVSLVLNKYSKNIFYTYIPAFISYFILSRTLGTIAPSIIDAEILVNIIVIAILVFRFSLEKFNLVRKEKIPLVIPGLMVAGLLVFLLVTYINVDIGIWFNALLERIQKPLSADVIGSTVAESQTAEGFFGDAPVQFGTVYAISSTLAWPEILRWFSVFYIALLGLALMAVQILYKYFRTKSMDFKHEYIFSYTFVILSIIASIGAVRLGFFLAFPIALVAGYMIIKSYDYFLRYGQKLKIGKNYLIIIAAAVILVIFVSHSASAYMVETSIGPGLDESWQKAFLWIKNNTDKKDTVLEWWDYGYWFQLIAERRTHTDGGFHTPDPLVKVAQFYTEPLSNKSMMFLKNYSVDYVMVSPDLIGKFGALSKIANWGAKVDFLPVFYLSNRYQDGDKIMMEYSSGDQKILVALSVTTTNETTTLNNITAVYQYGKTQMYISDISIGDQIIRTNRSNAVPGMVYIAGDAIIFIPEAVEESVFVKLYLFDGKGLGEDFGKYFEKVYDDSGMKIYKVKYENFPDFKVYNPNIPEEDRI